MPSGYRRGIVRAATNLDQPGIQLDALKLPTVSIKLMLQLHQYLKTRQEQDDGNPRTSTEKRDNRGGLTLEAVDSGATNAAGGRDDANAASVAAVTRGSK